MRPFSCVCVRSVAPVSSSPGVLLHAPETNVSRETPHVRRLPQAFSRPTEAPRPRPLRPPPGPARLTHPRVRLPGPRASRSCASLASRPGLRILAPRPHPRLSLAPPGPARLARVPACACAPRRPRRPRAPGFCIRAVRRLPRHSLSLRFRCQNSLNLSDIN